MNQSRTIRKVFIFLNFFLRIHPSIDSAVIYTHPLEGVVTTLWEEAHPGTLKLSFLDLLSTSCPIFISIASVLKNCQPKPRFTSLRWLFESWLRSRDPDLNVRISSSRDKIWDWKKNNSPVYASVTNNKIWWNKSRYHPNLNEVVSSTVNELSLG